MSSSWRQRLLTSHTHKSSSHGEMYIFRILEKRWKKSSCLPEKERREGHKKYIKKISWQVDTKLGNSFSDHHHHHNHHLSLQPYIKKSKEEEASEAVYIYFVLWWPCCLHVLILVSVDTFSNTKWIVWFHSFHSLLKGNKEFFVPLRWLWRYKWNRKWPNVSFLTFLFFALFVIRTINWMDAWPYS